MITWFDIIMWSFAAAFAIVVFAAACGLGVAIAIKIVEWVDDTWLM